MARVYFALTQQELIPIRGPNADSRREKKKKAKIYLCSVSTAGSDTREMNTK